MTRPSIRTLAILVLAAVLGCAHAFQWEPFAFPPGDQGYTIEITSSEGVLVLDVDIVDQAGAFDIRTVMTFDQVGVGSGDLAIAMFGGSGISMFGFGPMMLFGPSYFILPMALGQQEIAVREDRIDVLGMGTMVMEREVEIAGRDCVVILLTLASGDELEFAIAEDLPLPCYSRYGTGANAVEARLLEVR
jgi:hypothetical protein